MPRTCRDHGFGLRVWGLGFGVPFSGAGFEVRGFGFRAWGPGFKIQVLRLRF